MAARQPRKACAAADTIEEIGSRVGVREEAASSSREEATTDVSGNSWEVSLLERQLPDRAADGLYVFHNTFHLLPRGIGRLGALKTLKVFSNDIEVLPPEVVDLVKLERLQLKVSSPEISGLSLQKLKSLTELELSKTPPRLSASSILSEISGLKCLTRLSICHFSIRYLPPEVSNLKKLQELDISFNKLKNLPDVIAELGSLKSLNIANNKLVDPPPCISLMSSLERLDLSNNKLTSLTSLRLSSMLTLQHLNLQHNNLPYGFAIPYWIRCKFEGNIQGNTKFQISKSSNASELYDPAIHRAHSSRYCNGCHSTSSCSHLELSNSIRCHVARRMKRRGWNRHIYIQQRGRQERLNYSRKCKGEDPNRSMNLKMVEEPDISSFIEPVTAVVFEESAKEDVPNCSMSLKMVEEPDISSFIEPVTTVVFEESEKEDAFHNNDASAINSDGCCLAKESESNEVGLLESHPEEQSSCATYNSICLNKDNEIESEREDNEFSFHPISSFDVSDEQSSCETSTVTSKSKRHSEKDLDNPKPRKFRKPVEDCSDLSCKYSIQSYCSIDDFIPDGFYDAGRDRPFKSLLDFEQSLCLDSREVILLDREKDEDLDAIVFSAQLLMSRLKRPSLSGREDNIVDDLHRASILALFVSDCFGGSERSGSILKMRRSLLGLRKQQPFICTCSAGYNFEKTRPLENKRDTEFNVCFSELCDNSLQVIKKSRNSNIVPIGALRFGVCRHRAVLMKYLCDRVDPPIPCELVRGYLDFMPHAWNTVCVRRGNACVRMVVDACYPTDIREETDLEYFCRYVPLSRFLVPLETGNSTVPTLSIPFSLNYQIKSTSKSVIHCKFGALDAAIKVRYLIAEQTFIEEIRAFEHMLLGEVRILGALRNHKHIVHIYGHQLSCKWLPAEDGNKDHKLLQSMIIMEHVNGGSLKNYLDQLREKGRKHAPADIALCIARDVACALVEVHSKQIIHRDIKSENILVDFVSRADTVLVVKLCDFDRSVPLHSTAHTCCIAHLGIHPPNVCVGTPRWMAPEVVQAMHQKHSYGLEVDIWSYGCLLLELLTLELPYQGLSESELYKLLQMQQRPMLTPELEALAGVSQDEPTAQSKTTVFSSNAEFKILKCLVDLFFQCTHGDPSHRPSAKHIYDSLLTISSQLETADHDTGQ